MKSCEKPAIISNLDTSLVTWAQSYCSLATKSGLEVVERVDAQKSGVFIGDDIDRRDLDKLNISAYFLAALDKTPVENSNIAETDLTLLPSSTERKNVVEWLPYIDGSKLVILGFPIDIDSIRKYAVPWYTKNSKSICFAGEVKPIKNPEFELEVISKLTKLGYVCSHLSPGSNPIGKEIAQAGGYVYANLRCESYYSMLARNQYIVNTSHRESLYISGIEGALLGSVPIVPQNAISGYVDWCPQEYMYVPGSVDSLLATVTQADHRVSSRVKVGQYDYKAYFNNLSKLMKKYEEMI